MHDAPKEIAWQEKISLQEWRVSVYPIYDTASFQSQLVVALTNPVASIGHGHIL